MGLRVLVSTVGSTGDLNPFLALGRALTQAGHEPTLFTSRHFASTVEGAGLAFRDSMSPASEAGYEKMLRIVVGQKNPFKQVVAILDQTMAEQLCSVAAARDAASSADVVVAHAMDFAAVGAALATGRPLVAVLLFPTLLTSRNLAPTGRSLGRAGNAIAWAVTARMTRWLTDRQVNRVLTAFGLPFQREALFGISSYASRTLLAVSPSVVPTDPLWSDRVIQTGYWFFDDPLFEPDSRLARFLAEGPAPFVISFGSMSGVDAQAVTETLIDAVQCSGRRAILQSGWARLGEGSDLPPSMLRVGYVPHAWLLPQTTCLVHHGGAGTTAAAFRAGVPQIVVWHMGDQMYWGARVEALDVGPRRLHHHKLDPRRLAERIARVHRDDRMAVKARQLSERIGREDGLGAAVRAIEGAGLEAAAP